MSSYEAVGVIAAQLDPKLAVVGGLHLRPATAGLESIRKQSGDIA
jgi:hypothetical protein